MRLGTWERLLALVQETGIKLGMTFLDGTNIRAHQKAAGARRKGDLLKSEMSAKRLAALVEAMGPRLLVMADGAGHAIAFRLAPGQAHELPHADPLLGRLSDAPK